MSKTTKAQLEQMLAEAQARTAALEAENAKLRGNKRPHDALNIGGVIAVFSNGTHKDLIGKRVKCHVPPDAIGSLYASCEVKETSNGNAFLTLRGWIDPSKLDLSSADSDSTASSKATKSFKDQVVNG